MNLEGLKEDDVVISGVGCKLPDCDNLLEVAEKLYEGINTITADDPKKSCFFSEKVPNFSGKIKGLKDFDNLYFSISNIVASNADPMMKHTLERTLEALVDAGLNPADLKETDTSVYATTSHSDFDLLYQTNNSTGYSIMGRNRCMSPNRISWWLDLKGTSVALDGSWSNGVLNLMRGWEAIREGRCDTSIISTCHLNMLQENNVQFHDFKRLSPDGTCKSYDDSADGFCRSDAVVVFVLQRANIAKRCYAVIDNVMQKFYGERSGPIATPSQQDWELLFKEFYYNSKINVNDICYIEGQGTGIKDEDAAELNAINSFFCKNRESPLLLGSVKTNIGHTESASASCSIIKAIICMEQGVIPRTIHYTTPNAKCTEFLGEKIKIVSKNSPLPINGRIAINAQGLGNSYAHIVLRPNPKTKKQNYDEIPRLVLLSARMDDLMDDIINKVENCPIHVEQISLLNEVFTRKVDKYLSRGYTIVPKINDVSIQEHQVFDPIQRPVWFIFSGMGSQWCQMGRRLMDLPLFRESIEKCHEILEGKNLNLIEIITTDDPKVFDNILHSFVGIAAVQIALVDILHVLGIVPDGMIGHSVGELGCAYADGCLTAEQTILCAYSRGKASIETPLIKGFMAAIGKGYNDIKDELPEGIEVACRNAATSCTISGPAESVQNYVQKLQDRKIFARTVNVANIAYHSQYIKPAAPKLLQYLQEVIPQPKLRSEKWISTSNLEENWETEVAKYCSAEYHTNNLLSSVFFEEGSKKIPENAICIEIAPHGLLQAILKRSLGKDCVNIPLTNRTAKDPLKFFLQAVGKMYMAGLSPQVNRLYPKIEYPVSKGTPPLSHFVTWQHGFENTFRFRADYEKKIRYFLKEQFARTANDETGYLIDGKNYYPLSVFLDLTWKAFATLRKVKIEECPVVFEDVRVEKLLMIQDSETESAVVSIGLGTGKFEINTDEIVIKGTILPIEELPEEPIQEEIGKYNINLKEEIYTDFKRRGYQIGSDLQCLESIDINKNVWKAKIDLSSDLLQTIESMIQIQLLEGGKISRSTALPLSIERLSIIPTFHSDYKNFAKESNYMEITFDSLSHIIKCGGITLKGLQTQPVETVTQDLKFEAIKFVPFQNSIHWELWEMIDYCYEIVSKNLKTSNIRINQITNGIRVPAVASYLEKKFTSCKVTNLSDKENENTLEKSDLVICDEYSLSKGISLTEESGFIFVKVLENRNLAAPKNVDIITTFSTNNDKFALLTKHAELKDEVDYLTIPNNDIILHNMVKNLENVNRVTYLISYTEPEEGFENFRKRIQEKTAAHLRWILILDEKAPKFDPKNSFYSIQLQKGLACNVYRAGSWGSFYKKTFTRESFSIDSSLINTTQDLTVSYVGLNLNDNLVPDQQVEYSGVLQNNTKLIGIAEIKETKKLSIDKCLQWKLPESWTLEEGATVPISHALAYYCLKIKGLWNRYMTVLVTDGLSCNGMAQISVSLSLGFRVYVTVNNVKEVAIIKELFPSLNESDIVSHEDNDFDVQLGLFTKGDYFDMILNNVENEKLVSALNCVAFGGTLFHFKTEDFTKNAKIGMNIFLGSVGFYGISPGIISRLSIKEKEEIQEFISSGIEKGQIKPLPKVVYTSKDIKKIEDKKEILQNRKKIIFTNDYFQLDENRLVIDPEKSYIIIGDTSDFWIDVAEWLTSKNVKNIVVNLQKNSEDSWNRMKKITNIQNINIQSERDATSLLKSAQKLAQIAAIFVIKMDESSDLKFLNDLDKVYRDKEGHLIVISRKEDAISHMCSKRIAKDYNSTNFIWKNEERLTNHHLTTIENLSGQDSVIRVSDETKASHNSNNHSRMLADILPSSIEEFSELGSSLKDEINLVQLPSLGQKCSDVKEVTPLFVLPGLKKEETNKFRQLAKSIMYPIIVIKLPHKSGEITIEELAELILPKIQLLNNSKNVYNILGISWGSYVALELTKLIEKSGGNVSLVLIDGPLKDLKTNLAADRTLQFDLLNIIRGISKNVVQDLHNQDSFFTQMEAIVAQLGVSLTQQKQIKDAITYIYHNLRAMIKYSYDKNTYKGPITILKSNDFSGDISIKKTCNNVSIRSVPLDNTGNFSTKEVLQVINGSFITPGMNEDAINLCSYKELEEFLINDKIETLKNKIYVDEMIKTGRQIYIRKEMV